MDHQLAVFFVIFCILLSHCSCQTIDYINNSARDCLPNATECYITSNSFVNMSLNYGSGTTWNCPTTNNCNYCQVDCIGDYACAATTVHGQNCQTLEINFYGGNNVGYKQIIHAPGNDGSLIISSRNKSSIVENIIYSKLSTNEISIECNGCNITDSEIYAQNASSMVVECTNGAYCDGIDVFCPNGVPNGGNNDNNNNNNNNNNNSECDISCIESEACRMNSFINNSIWSSNDVDLECMNSDCMITVYCDNYGNENSCLMTGNGICNLSLTGTGCQYVSQIEQGMNMYDVL